MERPIVLTIAGFDPSGGAGLQADIKTFEQHKVYGLSICSAQTLQTENKFFAVNWQNEECLLEALQTMLLHYKVDVVKIGIMKNIEMVSKVVACIHKINTGCKIVWDTVIKSSSGFDFWKEGINDQQLFQLLSNIYLITPNYNEAKQLVPSVDNAKDAAQYLALYCNVLLKGGHNEDEKGVDYLYADNTTLKLTGDTVDMYEKHGSGCVLSAAITATLALGAALPIACKQAKKYIERFLSSNKTLLGYHYV
jgi:hydroxymethylpyrimidine/phosphomethylpyrimidine kinase